MDKNKLQFFENKCKKIRYSIVEEISEIGSGHVGGSLSIVEVLTVLYNNIMNIDPKNPKMENRDRFVLSKGHAGAALYAVLADKGYFDESLLYTLNKCGGILPSHCDMNKTPGVDMTAGSLGQGISCAVGMAKALKIKKSDAYVYCLVGDGEAQEGEVWEASMAAAHFNLNNLILFLDYNKMQIDGNIKDVMNLNDPHAMWESFGFNTYSIDGHNIEEINNTILDAKKESTKPSMIILNTIKGKGVSFVEKAGYGNHSMAIKMDQRDIAKKELQLEEA